MANFYGLSNSFYHHVLRTYILTLLTMLMTYIIPNVFVLFLSKLRHKKPIATYICTTVPTHVKRKIKHLKFILIALFKSL